jgi:hypothetical protein
LIIIVVCAILAFVLGFEIGARRDPRVKSSWPLMGQDRIYHPFFKAHVLAAYHPKLGWYTTPNWQRDDLHTFATCDHGTRLPTKQQRPLPIGGILACGNSFTVGSGVENGDSWPAQLEKIIGMPVINAAVGGYGTDQIVLRTEQMIDLAKPKAVVLGLMWFDALNAELKTYSRASKPYYTIKNDKLRLHNSPAPAFNGICHSVAPLRWLVNRSCLAFTLAGACRLLHWPSEEGEAQVCAVPGTGPEISRRVLRRLKSKADRLGIELVVIMQASADDFGEPDPLTSHTALANAVRDAGIPMVDVWPHIKQLHDHEHAAYLELFIEQPNKKFDHMSVKGNGFIAEQVASMLRSLEPTES